MFTCFAHKSMYIILSFLFFVFAAISPRSLADLADNEVQKKVGDAKPSGPYCGLYCLYTIMELAGQKTDFRQLVKSEYLGSRKGSSLAELKKASLDSGLHAEPVTNIASQELKTSKYPIILHVKREDEDKRYNHYVLFLGDKDGKARIFNPPNPVEAISYYELAPQWDGTGLIVSPEPINLSQILALAQKRFVFFAGAVIAAIVLVRAAEKYLFHKVGTVNTPIRLGLSIAQSAGLVGIALFVSVVYHFINDVGFLAHAGATESVVKASAGSFIPKVSATEVAKNRDSAVIIDARQTADYDMGHIEGAINIPTTLCAAGRSAKLGNAPKDGRVIIYCQSAGCPYAGIVAANLTEDGFSNTAIYKGGWVDWQKNFGAKNETK